MDPTPPIAGSVAHAAASGQGAARMPPPVTPLAKPVSRGVLSLVAIALAGVTDLPGSMRAMARKRCAPR